MSNIFEINFTEMFEQMVSIYQDQTGHVLERQDAERLMFQIFAGEIYYWGSAWLAASAQNFLDGMTDDQLDAYGAFSDTPRLPSSPASTIFRFEFTVDLVASMLLLENTSGTGTNKNGTFTFKILQDTYVDKGTKTFDVKVYEYLEDGTNSGALANDIEIGNIASLDQSSEALYTDNIIESISNVAESEGGKDSELDDDYRERLRIAPSKYSTAGTYDGYRFWGRSADAAIADIGLLSPIWDIFLYVLPKNFDGSFNINLTGDAADQIENFELIGLAIDEPQLLPPVVGNTLGGLLYWDLTDAAGTRTLTVYKDASKTVPVANYVGADGLGLSIAAVGGSGVTGTFDLAWTVDDTDAANIIHSAMESVQSVQSMMYPDTGYSKVRPINDIVHSKLIEKIDFTITSIDVEIDTDNIETVKNKTLQGVDIFIGTLKNKAGRDAVLSALKGIIAGIDGVRKVDAVFNSTPALDEIEADDNEVLFGEFASVDLTITVKI